MEKEITMKIGGREIPLYMSVWETAQIQEEIGCTVGQLRDFVFGIQHDIETDEYRFDLIEDKDKMRRLGTLIRILGNAGLEEKGMEPDLTDKWILRHMKPGMLIAYAVVMTAVINQAMQTESGGKQDGPVDELLEEENRKKEPGSSPSGESAPAGSSPG